MMEASRELDVAIAEKVMGLDNVVYRAGHFADGSPWYGASFGTGDGQQNVPAFSTDIAAAWTVVENLKQSRKMAFVLGSNGCSDQISVWFNDGTWALGHQQNECPDFDDPHLLGAATESSTPLAICIAALKALATKERGI